jgi:predicted ATPase
MNRILERSGMEEQIQDFLLHFNDERDDKQYKRGTYVYGSSGIGKTRFVESILDDMGYDIVKYDAGDVRNKALIDTLTNNMSNNNVLRLMYKERKR